LGRITLQNGTRDGVWSTMPCSNLGSDTATAASQESRRISLERLVYPCGWRWLQGWELFAKPDVLIAVRV